MNCERVKEQIPECLAGRLEKAEREKVIEHLETCAGCRGELADLGSVWRGLEALSLPAEPEPVMKNRFMEVMEAYREGLLAAQAHVEKKTAPAAAAEKKSWVGFWPRRPIWQFALTFALLMLGVFAGRFVAAPHSENPEMAQLKGQIEGLRQLVALSLLQEQSPSQRMQGVTYSIQMAQPDAQVEQALLAGGDARCQHQRTAGRGGGAGEVRVETRGETGAGRCHRGAGIAAGAGGFGGDAGAVGRYGVGSRAAKTGARSGNR